MEIDTDNQKARLAYKLEILKLIIDKLLLGVVVLALGFAANLALEQYRRETARQEFFLAKRLEAVDAIRTAYADMFDRFDTFSLDEPKGVSKSSRGLYKKAINEFARAQFRWGTLLSFT